MRESKIESYFVDQAEANGGETRKIKYIGRHAATDRVLFFDDGEIYWIELKRPRKKAENHQAREHKRLRARGQNVFVLDTIRKIDVFFKTRKKHAQ